MTVLVQNLLPGETRKTGQTQVYLHVSITKARGKKRKGKKEKKIRAHVCTTCAFASCRTEPVSGKKNHCTDIAYKLKMPFTFVVRRVHLGCDWLSDREFLGFR